MSELPRMTSELFPEDEPATDNRALDRLGTIGWLLCALIIGATLGAIV